MESAYIYRGCFMTAVEMNSEALGNMWKNMLTIKLEE